MSEEYPPNSHKKKVAEKKDAEPQRKIERVTTSDVVRKKKSLGRKFMETFIGGDARSVSSYVAQEVALPAVKSLIADVVREGVDRTLFGEVRSASRRPGRPSGGIGRVDYNGVSRGVDPRERGRGRATHNFDELYLTTRVEAEEVINRLFDQIESYGTATVSDLYELVGETPEWTDGKWGWTDLGGADVRRGRNGYMLNLPRPVALD